MKRHPERGGIINGGEASALSGMLIYFIGFVFLLTCIIRGSSKNGDGAFYLWLSLAVLVPIIIVANM